MPSLLSSTFPLVNATAEIDADKIMGDVLQERFAETDHDKFTFLLPSDVERVLSDANALDRASRLGAVCHLVGVAGARIRAGQPLPEGEFPDVVRTVKGASDIYPEQVTGGLYLDIKPNREAAARYGIDVAEIQKVRGLPVRRQIAFGQFKPYPLGIVISLSRVVHGQCQQLCRVELSAERIAQVGRESRDPALPW